MLVAQPAVELAEAPYAAVAARQLSVWPFPTRTLRLFVLVDASLPDPTPRHGLLRAMQQAYFCSDGFSQTRAVREAALAAHYVLQHHNRDVLPARHVKAAAAVAAVRSHVAFAALTGDAAVFAWRGGVLTGQRGMLRLPRPLGLEQDPPITLWSTRLDAGDRLLLVCGATWRSESHQLIQHIFEQSGEDGDDRLEELLISALSGARRAGVLVVDPSVGSRPERHVAVVSIRQPDQRFPRTAIAQHPQPAAPPGRAGAAMRWASRILALLMLGILALVTVNPTANALPPLATLHEAAALLAQADASTDEHQAHALAASALEMAQRGGALAPPGEAAALVAQATTRLDAIDRVYRVSPDMAVRLGPSGADVVDLTVGDDTLYTLDVVEASVRAFPLDARDQQPTPDTLVVRTGAPVGVSAQLLATPVAIQYLSGPRPELGVLAIIDQARTVVQVGRDGSLNPRPVAGMGTLRELGAIGADTNGSLYVLDSGARRLLEYTSLDQPTLDPPRLLLDATRAPDLAFERAAEIVGQQDDVYVRMDDGTLRRFDTQGREKQFVVRTPDGTTSMVSAVAPDRAGGLYLADSANARILHTTAEGAVLRQLRDPALAGVRQLRSSLDGRRLYGLVTSGILVFDVPQETAE